MFASPAPAAPARPSHTLLALGAIVAIGAASNLGGCVGYNVYPPMEGQSGFTNPNSDPFPPVMTNAMQWVVLRYPPHAEAEWNAPAAGNVGTNAFAVNLPKGMDQSVARRIVKNIGNGAEPLVAGNETLPIYSISRVWVQGDDAKVDIVRPVVGMTGADGKPLTQGITVRLRGGLKPWTVTSHRLWSYNSMPQPALNFLPDDSPAAPQMRPATPAEPATLDIPTPGPTASQPTGE